MKLFKKLATLLTLALVIGFTVPGVLAKASNPEPPAIAKPTVKVSYENETVEVAADSADTSKYVYYTDKYDATKEAAGKQVWDKAVLASKKATIDISWTKSTAEVKLYFKTDKSPVSDAVVINPIDSKFIAGYSGATKVNIKKVDYAIPGYGTDYKGIANPDVGYLYFGTGDTFALLGKDDLKKVEWRKGTTGKWSSDPKTLDLSLFGVKGATIYFRVAASDTNKNRVSKEVKVAYAKQATAPKVAIDGTKWTIALKKGLEYQIDDSGVWVSVDKAHMSGTKVDPVKLADLGTTVKADGTVDAKSGFDGTKLLTIQVRVAGTDKKIPSQIAEIKVEKPDDAGDTLKVNASTDSKFTISYTKPYDATSGLVFTNESSYAVQVAVMSKGTGENPTLDTTKIDITDKNLKWITVPAKKGEKNGVGKYTPKKGETIANPAVIYRLASIKAVAARGTTAAVDFKIASPIDQIDFPKATAQTIIIASADASKLSVTASATEPVVVEFEVETTGITAETAPKITKKSGTGVTLVSTASKIAKGGVTGTPIKTKFKFTVAKNAAAGSSVFEVVVEGTKLEVTVVVGTTVTKVVLDTGSQGTAGDKEITGLTTGTRYKVTVAGKTYGVKADGTVNTAELSAVAPGVALTGTKITGLTNGTTYKVEVDTIA